ncbi:meiotic recombination protein W68 [Drosophila bipectinata]|uniref:meiotic recombination protein W68 n=1 Tax=Drosophila bipectinata TaxID=42026 RepID=UPI001C8A6B16|nr:meiotic recombination protein W68 [Drosophila bipectinata]
MSECANRIERIVLELLGGLVNGDASLRIPRSTPTITDYRRVSYNNRRSRHTFCLVVYLLARTHNLQVHGGSYTVRGLYYGDPELVRSQNRMARARLDVCRMLSTSPMHLGVLAASKGLVAGDIQFQMTDGGVLDCNVYGGAVALPTNPENVERMVTQADLVLVVEKESVFQSLLSRNIFSTFGGRFILITGKGYPDCCTRRILHRLTEENHLPAYILVDADPFGIEIMLVYRHGSQAMSFSSQGYTTPALRWMGLHPSEIPALGRGAVALGTGDNKKINDLLARTSLEAGVRQELRMLQEVQLKAEIESVIGFLSEDYIPNKIKRNLFL